MPSKTVRVVAGVVFLACLALGACECESEYMNPNLGELEAVPDPVEFGEVPVSTIKTIDVTLTNRGTATVHFHDLEIKENETDFSLRIPPELIFPHAIPPGNQVVFSVRYHPKVYPEEDTGIALITSTDKSAPEYDLVLLGTAVEPILLVDPVPVDFDSVRVMSTKPATLTITHTGSNPDPVTITALELTDSGEDDFKIQDPADLPLTLNPGEDTKVHLSYTPQAICYCPNRYEPTDVDDTCHCFPSAEISSDPCPYNGVNANAPDCQGEMTCLGIDADGTAGECHEGSPDECTQIADNWNPDCVAHNCGGSLCAGTCSEVAEECQDEGTFTIESDAASQEHIEVPLFGSSHAPAIEVSTQALNFGTVSIDADPSLPFSIRSVGTDELSITEMKLSVTGSQKFSFNPASIGAPIEPLDQVEVWVTYDADDRGDDNGTLQISHDDPLAHPVFIQLHGRTPCPDVDVRPDFITIQIAKESHSQSTDIRIYNVGDENLLVTGHDFVDNPNNDGYFTVVSSPTYAATVAPGSIPAGPYETLVIRYDHPDSTATVDDNCTITFFTDDPDEASVPVRVVGTYSP